MQSPQVDFLNGGDLLGKVIDTNPLNIQYLMVFPISPQIERYKIMVHFTSFCNLNLKQNSLGEKSDLRIKNIFLSWINDAECEFVFIKWDSVQ